jgi:RNA polymerase sigma-70 factor (ECF subfamily)
MALKINNETEFSELFELHYEELCKVVMPIVHDIEAAEDIVQDVFVKVWIRRNELEVNTTFKAYLYKASVFRALDYLRKKKSSDIAYAELKIVTSYSHSTTDSNLREKELSNAINSGMEKMTNTVKAIFQLSRFGGLKNREIAEELNISIKTVESNMGKALKIMHEHLSPFLKNTVQIIVCGFLLYNLIDLLIGQVCC